MQKLGVVGVVLKEKPPKNRCEQQRSLIARHRQIACAPNAPSNGLSVIVGWKDPGTWCASRLRITITPKNQMLVGCLVDCSVQGVDV